MDSAVELVPAELMKCLLWIPLMTNWIIVSLMRSQRLTSTQEKHLSAAVWTTPAEVIWTVQTNQESQSIATPSQTIWPHHSVPRILPILPKDEFIIMVSSPEKRLHQSKAIRRPGHILALSLNAGAWQWHIIQGGDQDSLTQRVCGILENT